MTDEEALRLARAEIVCAAVGALRAYKHGDGNLLDVFKVLDHAYECWERSLNMRKPTVLSDITK